MATQGQTWTIVGGVAGIVSAIAAVVAVVPIGARPPADTAQAPAARAASSAPIASTPPTGNAGPTAGTGCHTATGDPVSCAQPDAGVVVQAVPCDPDAVARALGVDPALRQLDLDVRPNPSTITHTSGQACWVAPGPRAVAAGASAGSFALLARGDRVDALSLCMASEQGPEVACSQPHVLEFVGPWKAADGVSTPRESCEGPARRYTQRTFDAPSEPLTVVLLSDGTRTRCALKVARPVSRSAWQVGGAPLG